MRLHLVSDLDGTWLPPPGRRGDLSRLEAFLEGHPEVSLTFATGRSLESALGVLEGLGALLPGHLITDVGTAIFSRNRQGSWVEWAPYGRWVEGRWNGELVGAALRGHLPAGVGPQPGLSPRRRMALLSDGAMVLEAAAESLRLRLLEKGVEADVLATPGHCLDVLPRAVNKGSAVGQLQHGKAMPRPLVVCGDSRNDLEMLRIADLAVLMPDASLSPEHPALRTEALLRPRAPGPLGILEALVHLGGGGSP